MLIAKDSPSKYEYFEKLVKSLNELDNNQYIQNKKGKSWTKQFSNNYKSNISL
jgi:hypothetical protein